MDATAFRSSVFSEQKQLDAFVGRTPEERRKLVLQLLGITPLDKARDAAKADANARAQEHQRLVAVLPDLARAEERHAAARTALEAADAQLARATEEGARAAAASEAATAAFESEERRRREHDEIVTEGKGVRAELERAQQAVARIQAELAELAGREQRRAELEPLAATVGAHRAAVDAWGHVVQALQALEAAPAPLGAPNTADVMVLAKDAEAAEAALAAADDAWSAAEAARRSAAELLEAARRASERLAATGGMDTCPTCGQAIGADVEAARDHRAAEASRLEAAVAEADARLGVVASERSAARQRASAARAAVRTAEDALRHAEVQRGAHSRAEQQVHDALRLLAGVAPGTGSGRTADPGARSAPSLADALRARTAATTARAEAEAAAAELAGHEGALARRAAATAELQREEAAVRTAGERRQALLESMHRLAFDPSAHAAAGEARRVATERAGRLA